MSAPRSPVITGDRATIAAELAERDAEGDEAAVMTIELSPPVKPTPAAPLAAEGE